MRKVTALLSILGASTLSCVCSHKGGDGGSDGGGDFVLSPLASGFTLNVSQAHLDLAEIAESAHPFGSARQAEVLKFLEDGVKAKGITATFREGFESVVPNPEALNASGPVNPTLTRTGTNLYAFGGLVTDPPCVVLVASHYDSKDIPGIVYLGANDSGSSSALLMQLITYLKSKAEETKTTLTCDIAAVWFDGEEAILTNWTDGETIHPAKIQDNTYGSRHAVKRLTTCTYEGKNAKCLPANLGGKPLAAIVLLDMIGSPDLQISQDSYSSQLLVDMAIKASSGLGFGNRYGKGGARPIEDDHIPYRKAGIAGIDLIDFNDTSRWHKAGDDPAFVSTDSMQMAGQLGLALSLEAARRPLPLVENP